MPKTTEQKLDVLLKLAEQQLANRAAFTDWMRVANAACCKKPGNTCLASIEREEANIAADRKLLAEML